MRHRPTPPRPRPFRAGRSLPALPAVLLLSLLALLPAPGRALAAEVAEAAAVPTRLVVRVVAHDAKVLGDHVGGAMVVVQDADTGEVLASGVQHGSTGDTDRIMRRPRERGDAIYATEGAAAFRATLELRRPTRVEITAYGPLLPAHATLRASKQLWLVPGGHVEGDGVVLELYGLTVEVLAPGSDGVQTAGGELAVRAKVTMLCGCPTEPGGLWDADRMTIGAALLAADGGVVAEGTLTYAGETSTYGGSLTLPGPGVYRLRVTASAPHSGNFGVAEQAVAVAASPAAGSAAEKDRAPTPRAP